MRSRCVLSGSIVVVACASWLAAAEPVTVSPRRAEATSSSATRPAVVSPAGAQPAITVDAADHDFGESLAGGAKLEHKFKITNTGTAELKITAVKPTCGCTVAGDYPKTLAPGASGEFPFSLTTSNVNGPFKKVIIVTSSDPVKPTLTLALKGEVKLPVVVEPTIASLEPFYGEQIKTRVVTIRNRVEAPLKVVLDPLSSKGGWTFDLVEKEPGRLYELTSTFNSKGTAAGPVRQTATLLTNVESQHQIQVNAMATVHDRVEAEPRTLMVYMPATQPAQGLAAASRPAAAGLAAASQPAAIARLIRVHNYGDRPVKAIEATASDSAIQVSLKEQEAGKAYLVSVSIPPTFVASRTSEITVKTDDAEKPVVRIPVVTTRPAAPVQANMAAARPMPTELVGKDAPAFSLTTLDGKAVSKRELRDAVTVLNFFAPTCPHCRKQMPRVEAMRAAYEAKGVRFLFVGETMGRMATTAADLTAKLKDLGVNAPAAVDAGNQVGRSFNVSSYPTMLVLGKGGKVEAVNSGNSQDLETRLRLQLDALLAGKSLAVVN